jgi:hypothetical protein
MKPSLMRKAIALIFSVLFYYTVSGQGTLIDFNTIPKSGTALMLCHMDDDVIWMLPWWKITEKFISAVMPSTPTYQTVVDQQQSYMDAHGYNIDYKSNWIVPWGSLTMKQYSDYYWDFLPEADSIGRDHILYQWDENDTQTTRKEVNWIKAKIEQYIASPTISRVITHNNWGEYGHQKHKALNLAVRELGVKYRKDIWMLGARWDTFDDVDVPNGVTYTMGSFNDPDLYTSIRTIYENNYVWTFGDNIPSGDHKFIKVVDAGADKSNLLTGETVTVSGPAQDQPGAYIFDGIDDYMTIWGNKTSAFTIAMWVRPDIIRSMDISRMTEYPENPSSDRNLYVNANGTVSARIYDGASKVVTSTSSLSANTWTHVVMTGNGTTLKIYINGLPESTIPAGSAVTSYTSPEFVMGQPAMTTSFFRGQLNDVRLYDYSLTDSEIAALSGIKYAIVATAGSGGSISPSGSVAVASGSNQTFTISPNSNYSVSDVKVDNISVGAVSSYTFTNVKAAHTIDALFSPVITHTITVTQGNNGTISPSGSVIVPHGENQSFTINGNIGYQVADVLVDGVSVGAVSSYTFSNCIADHTITASFVTTTTFTLSASAGQGGSISPHGSIVVNQGAGQVFTVTPNTGYRISGVMVDNSSVGAVTSYTFNDIQANHTISASFAAIPIFTITATEGTGGSISPSGSISVAEGASVNFTIAPAVGYNLANVVVDNVSVGAVTSYTFSNISANHTISSSFQAITYTISSSAGSGGSISPSGSVSVNYGSNRTFSINPNTGYSVSNVLVDNVSMGPVTSYTFSNVTSDHTISATFSQLGYTITATAGTGGTITPSGAVNVLYGGNSTFTITPGTGYYIAAVTVDNVSVGAVSQYTFTGVTANHTIAATFAVSTNSIIASAGTGGSISPSGTITLNYGSGQTYTISPATGYRIADVLVDNVSVGPVATYTFSNVISGHTIAASFSKLTYNINVSAGTGGSITPSGNVVVSYGNSQTFAIAADYGYQLTDVKVDNVSAGPVSTYTFSNVISNHSIEASFSLLKYTITGSSGPGGSISPSGATTINHGGSLTYEITPESGYSIADVTVDGHSVGTMSEYTFNSVTGSHTIAATFSLLTYTLTGSAGPGGIITPSGSSTAEYGTSVKFTITPDNGYHIADVTVDGMSVGALDNYTVTNITKDHTVAAAFSINTFSITASSGANGSISPAGISSVNFGSSQSYSITPATGYRILDVRVDNTSEGAISSFNFDDVDADHTISATFELIPIYIIKSSSGKGGNISPSGSISIPEASNQTFEITPENGFRILRVVVDDNDLGEIPEYTFNSVLTNHSISAEFTSETEVVAYPNPFMEEFKVRIETPLQDKFDLYVYDVSSRVIYFQSDVDGNEITTVNMKSSPKGVYFVRLFYQSSVICTRKVIKY